MNTMQCGISSLFLSVILQPVHLSIHPIIFQLQFDPLAFYGHFLCHIPYGTIFSAHDIHLCQQRELQGHCRRKLASLAFASRVLLPPSPVAQSINIVWVWVKVPSGVALPLSWHPNHEDSLQYLCYSDHLTAPLPNHSKFYQQIGMEHSGSLNNHSHILPSEGYFLTWTPYFIRCAPSFKQAGYHTLTLSVPYNPCNQP